MRTLITLSIYFALLLSGCETIPVSRVPVADDEATAMTDQCSGWPENPVQATGEAGLYLIKEIQARLILQGYDTGQIDGIYGKKTELGIRAYQTDYHLLTDGRPSPELLEHLKNTQRFSGIDVIKNNLNYAGQSYE